MGIPIKKGFCAICNKENFLITDKCQSCYWNYRASLKPIKIKEIGKPISRQSEKMKIEVKKYLKIRVDYINKHSKCEVCKKASSTDVHHKKGKIGKLLTDSRYFLAVCRPCHQIIEMNPDWAKEMGYSLSRLKTETTK